MHQCKGFAALTHTGQKQWFPSAAVFPLNKFLRDFPFHLSPSQAMMILKYIKNLRFSYDFKQNNCKSPMTFAIII